MRTFLRQAGDRELETSLNGDALGNIQTESTWDAARGISVDGPPRGRVLRRVPCITAYDWASEDFFPHTDFYAAE